jgi:hypothetical protein
MRPHQKNLGRFKRLYPSGAVTLKVAFLQSPLCANSGHQHRISHHENHVTTMPLHRCKIREFCTLGRGLPPFGAGKGCGIAFA